MRLTLMPWAAPAVARLRVSPMTAPLAVAYERFLGRPNIPDGGGHDDAAVALLDHVGPCGPGGVERPDDVDGEVLLEVVHVGVGEAGPSDDAGVVDQDVEAPELLDGRIDERLRARGGGHVAVVGDGRPAGGDDLRRRRVDATCGVRSDALHRPAQVVDHDAGAPVGEQQCVGTDRCRAPHR